MVVSVCSNFNLWFLIFLSTGAIVSGSAVSTDQKVYEVSEGRSLNITVKVDNATVSLPATLRIIHKTSNHLVIVASFEVTNLEMNVVILPKTSRQMVGSYSFVEYPDVTFQVKVRYLSEVQFHQLTTDNSHVTYVKCTAWGFPKPGIMWVKTHNDSCFPENDVMADDVEVTESTSSFLVSQMIRPIGGESLAGRFMCIVNNGETTRNRSLSVYDPTYNIMLTPTLSLKTVETGARIAISFPNSLAPSSAVTYKVELNSSQYEYCPNRVQSFKFPQLETTVDDLCAQTVYNLKVTSLLTNCSSINRTIYEEEISFDIVFTIQAGTVASIVLSAILTIILITFVCWRLRHKSKSREFQFMHNLSTSTYSMAMDRPNSSVIELPDSSGYLAASDVTSPEHRQNSLPETSSGIIGHRISLRPPRISIESDYAIPYTPKQGNRMSAASLHESVASADRPGSVFLPDGSGYIAAQQENVPDVKTKVRFPPQSLSARRPGSRPLSLDIELARGGSDVYATVKKHGSADEHIYDTIEPTNSTSSRIRPKSYV